jgi:hypothetical protein
METSAGFNEHGVPWNKGKLIGQKAPMKLRRSGRYGSGSSSPDGQENSRCSTWQLTASSGHVI